MYKIKLFKIKLYKINCSKLYKTVQNKNKFVQKVAVQPCME